MNDTGSPMITIGMPLFNAEDFLEEALDSLLSQSYSNFKLLISDNASTDNTESICRLYAIKDSRVSYTRQASNQGAIANFSSVLEAADTPYFMWAAGDDTWATEYIEKCISCLEADKSLGLVASLVVPFTNGVYSPAMQDLALLASNRPWKTRYNYLTQPEELGKANIIYGVYLTRLIQEVAARNPFKASWGADMNLVYSCLCTANLYVIDQPLFFKRQPARVETASVAKIDLSQSRHEQIAWLQLRTAWGNYVPYYWHYIRIDASDRNISYARRAFLIGCTLHLCYQKIWSPLCYYLGIVFRHRTEMIKSCAAIMRRSILRNHSK